MTFKDSFKANENEVNRIQHNKPLYTFLGSYFGPNVDGIIWFIQNVLPHVNIQLRIIGRNMDKLKAIINKPNIEIFSNVSDLAPFMIESDYMLYPIFEGSGMKVKTCEALMYAKNIIGTPEAFSGYDIEDCTKVGGVCKTAQEFIACISHFSSHPLPRYNTYSRYLFLNKYSFESSLTAFEKIIFEYH
jgi:spore coat polysaccharide biosynthesis predicted glycosyltransferase SpsG